MKKLIALLVVAAIALVLAIWGNRIAGRTLDAQLAPLLSSELGLPVKLAPIKANLLRLQASSDRLVMGPEDNPAVVAKEVVVRLSLDALLKKEIRLEFASAEDLMVNVSKWPIEGGPLPENYHFLDQWLPTTLTVETGRYVNSEDTPYPLAELQWHRNSNGSARIAWLEERGAGRIEIDNTLRSLHALLDLAPIALSSTIDLPGAHPGKLQLETSIAPDPAAAYKITSEINGPGVVGRIEATGSSPWTLPEQSITNLNSFEADKASGLVTALSRKQPVEEKENSLDATLPKLNLPTHRGSVAIDRLRLGKETGLDTSFDFKTDRQGLSVSNLKSRGPEAKLTGSARLEQQDKGWLVSLGADMKAIDKTSGIAEQFVDSQWYWHMGHAKLEGSGNTWADLINSLKGDLELTGHHRDETETPVIITAQLDNRPGLVGLDQLALTLGEGHFRGSASLSNDRPRKLVINVSGENLDLDFLFDEDDDLGEPGLPIPEYLALFPGLEIKADLKVQQFTAPGLQLAEASAHLERGNGGGTFVARAVGVERGTLDIELQAHTPPGEVHDIQLDVGFTDLDIAALFNQSAILHSRTNGTMTFTGKGREMDEIFESMRGAASVDTDIRSDNNWLRQANDMEALGFSSAAKFVIDGKQITGVELSNLKIASLEQDLTGEVSYVDGRSPWLIADLRSRKLNVTSLLEMLPESSEEADRMDFLQALQLMGAARLSLDVDTLTIGDTPLSQAHLKVESARDLLDIKRLDFTSFGSRFTSRGKFTWKDDVASLDANAELANVNLDQFLIVDPKMKQVPVSGSAKISSTGSKVAELIANTTGHIELNAANASANQAVENRRRFSLVARRLSNGVKAEIKTLQWGETDLAGNFTYRNTTPPSLDVNVHAGTLSLLPWETALVNDEDKKGGTQADSKLHETARKSGNAVSRTLRAPLRLLGADKSSFSSERVFSSEPMDFSALTRLNASFRGSLDKLESSVLNANKVTFDGNIQGGDLTLKIASAALNGGNGELDFALASGTTPPTMSLTSDFQDVRGLSGGDTYTRSGFVSLASSGLSQAELAANARGLLFLDLGPGPFDYLNTTLLTADLASTIFQRLIPGIEDKEQQLECGTTVALVEDGMALTPYGFSVRTNQANILGRLKVNLHNEEVQMTFDSRSRRGVGLSVGNVFSNTVQVVGSISDPRIAPRATGLAWRSWAALMTAGMSVVGESVLKRVLASENPCESTHEIIEKKLCPKNKLAASSPLVCPSMHASAAP